MKKIFALLAFTSLVFVACGDDDEYIPQGPVTTFAGKLPTEIGDYSFQYDDQNRCVQIEAYSDVYYVIDYKKGTIVLEDELANVTFNKQGYITSLSMEWDERDGENIYKGSGKIKFSYNKAGQLESSVTSSKESGRDDGEEYTSEYNSSSVYTWENGNLVKATIESKERSNGEKGIWNETYSIRYGNDENLVEQNTYFQTEMMDECDALVLIGLFGKPSVNFPIECEQTEYENYGDAEYEYSESYSFTYDLNADNTIREESFDGYNIKYSYTLVDDVDSKSVCQSNEKTKPSLRSLFVRKQAKK